MVLPNYTGSSRYALINMVCIALANHDQPSQAVHNELTLLSGLIRTAVKSGSRIQVRFVYDESGRRGRVGLGQAEGKSIGFNDRRGKR